MSRRFTYFMARPGPKAPGWIGLSQWCLFVAWLVLGYWMCLGGGIALVESSLYPFHGVFAEELVWTRGVLPTLGMITAALLALEVWLQALWLRCQVAVEGVPGHWVWFGRRGPAEVHEVARMPGGAWLWDSRRRWTIAHGFVDGGDQFISACGGRRAPFLSPWRLASPLALGLLLLLATALVLNLPSRRDRSLRTALWREISAGHTPEAEVLVSLHPEMKPWARFLESQPACDETACLRRQIVARLEGLNIGPTYASDGVVLNRLLVLNGWSDLALKLSGEKAVAFDIYARTGRPVLARALNVPEGRGRLSQEVLLLLQEGRLEKLRTLGLSEGDHDTHRSTSLRAAAAYMLGDCVEAERSASRLMAPDSLSQARTDGDAPPTGLGALQRASKAVRIHASYSIGLAILGHLEGARKEWIQAETLALAVGLPGLLDVDRVLLRCLVSDGPWSAPPRLHGAWRGHR